VHDSDRECKPVQNQFSEYYSTGGAKLQGGPANQVSSRSFYIQVIPSRGAWPDLPVVWSRAEMEIPEPREFESTAIEKYYSILSKCIS
jgi:hypothetical protein